VLRNCHQTTSKRAGSAASCICCLPLPD